MTFVLLEPVACLFAALMLAALPPLRIFLRRLFRRWRLSAQRRRAQTTLVLVHQAERVQRVRRGAETRRRRVRRGERAELSIGDAQEVARRRLERRRRMRASLGFERVERGEVKHLRLRVPLLPPAHLREREEVVRGPGMAEPPDEPPPSRAFGADAPGSNPDPGLRLVRV